tara:strand:- start:234 stop:1049 length:816 start_codon:yes stop_codon:yes gene_type:complete
MKLLQAHFGSSKNDDIKKVSPVQKFLENDIIRRLISIIALTLIWGLASSLLNDKDLLPSPIKVAESIKYHFSQELFFHISITLFRVFISFFLAIIIGSVIGIAMGRSKILDDYFDGWLILSLNVPALVTIILCFIWFGLNEVAAILAVAVNKIPTVTVILREGTKAIDERLIDVGKIYKLSKLKMITEIILPQLYPYIVSAARSGLALIWKIVLVVELLGRSNGVGFKINEFFSMFDTTSILAYTFVFIFFIMSIEWFFIKPLEKKLTSWR